MRDFVGSFTLNSADLDLGILFVRVSVGRKGEGKNKKTKKTKKKEASNGIHLYAVLATNLLLLLAVVRRAERSPPRRPPMGYHHP